MIWLETDPEDVLGSVLVQRPTFQVAGRLLWAKYDLAIGNEFVMHPWILALAAAIDLSEL